MRVDTVKKYESRLPAGDTHPYRTGAWTPNTIEVGSGLDPLGHDPDVAPMNIFQKPGELGGDPGGLRLNKAFIEFQLGDR